MPSYYALAIVAAFASAAAAQESSCDVVGYDSGTVFAFLVEEDGALADRLACGGLCTATEGCVSFAYGDNSCLLYDTPVEGNIYAVETSPYTFNNLSCVEGEVEIPEEPEEPEPEVEEGEEPAGEGNGE